MFCLSMFSMAPKSHGHVILMHCPNSHFRLLDSFTFNRLNYDLKTEDMELVRLITKFATVIIL